MFHKLLLPFLILPIFASSCLDYDEDAYNNSDLDILIGSGDPTADPNAPLYPVVKNGVVNGGRKDFLNYCWDLFEYFSLPASIQNNKLVAGIPTQGTKVGEVDTTGNLRTTLWDSTADSTSVYTADGSAPAAWNLLADSKPNVGFVRPAIKIPGGYIFANQAVDPDITGIRKKADKSDIYYAVKMNEPFFDYLVGNKLFSTDGQAAWVDMLDEGTFRVVAFPERAAEFKSAWMVLSEEEINSGNYYMQKGRSMSCTADGTCTPASEDIEEITVGLVGIHIIVNNLPAWTWCTFENMNNQNTIENPNLPSGGPLTMQSLADETLVVNSERQDKNSGNYLRNYQANGVQWTNDAFTTDNTFDAPLSPKYDFKVKGDLILGNSVIETRLMKTSSCISCHAHAVMGKRNKNYVRLDTDQSHGLPKSDPNLPSAPIGYLGSPNPALYQVDSNGVPEFQRLNFVWSLAVETSGTVTFDWLKICPLSRDLGILPADTDCTSQI